MSWRTRDPEPEVVVATTSGGARLLVSAFTNRSGPRHGRSANAIPDADHRPTGPTQPAKAHALQQHDLQTRLGSTNAATVADWTSLINTLVPATRHDDYTPQLAENLAELASTGIDAHVLLNTTTGAPLPDDHAASAPWWRIQRHLPDPTDADAPNPPTWSAGQEPTMARDAHTDLEEARDPRPRAKDERRTSPVPYDRSRGPGMSR